MMIATRSTFASVLIVALAFAAPAHAQIAEAEALFREGKRLMKLGQTAQACDKFDASERLEPTDGTEINLANCREKNGQLATAWAMFAKAAAGAKRSGHTEREAEARRRAAELEPRLVYLTIVVPEASRINGLVIRRNDTAIDRALWDQSVPVDPDEYQISGEAPGHESWSTSVVVKTKSKTVEVPVLDKRPAGQDAAAAPSESRDPGKPVDAPVVAAAAPSRFTPRRKLAIAAAAVGVAAVGVGIGFGLYGNSLAGDADAICPGVDCGDAHAVDLNHSARSNALVANIGFAVGGAAIAGAAVMWLIGAPKTGETVSVVPTLGADRVGVGFARSF
jgi:tetratricopeptide (TPR) repeat protein